MKKPVLLLFLDFDNVMHWCGHELPMSRTEELARIVGAHPELDIVISSSWRESFTLDELKDLFPEEIAERIIGATPVIEPKMELNEEGELVAQEHGLREEEIGQFLQEHHWEGVPWVALDDALDLFHNPENLILVQEGIGPETIAEVDHWVAGVKGQPVLGPPQPR